MVARDSAGDSWVACAANKRWEDVLHVEKRCRLVGPENEEEISGQKEEVREGQWLFLVHDKKSHFWDRLPANQLQRRVKAGPLS